MESKTIRFEKDHGYVMDDILCLDNETLDKFFEYKDPLYWAIKSFTVQINIIEDEEKELFEPRCIHENRSILGICERCGEGITKLIEDEQ